jgi:cysteine-rich repeat protein
MTRYVFTLLGPTLARGIGLALVLTLAVTRAHSAPVCGNGALEAGEACDDGNLNGGDGCSSTCSIEQQCYDPGNTFSFFSWSDSYTSGGDSGVINIFDDAVDRTKYPNRVIPRFWIALGDIPFMADGNTRLDDLNDVLSNSADGQDYPFTCSASNGKFPYFVALGNHDVDGYTGTINTTSQSQYEYWRTVVGPKLDSTLVGIQNFRVGPSNGHDNRTTYSFDYKNAHFVIVNQYHDDPNYPTVDPVGCIRTSLYQWIDQDLAQTSKPLKFVFGHEPAWSFCSNLGGYGGEFCPLSDVDNQNPAFRPRPYSSTGSWDEAYGRHWGDSLDDSRCPAGSRDAFWAMLARHNVIAHYVGHTHTYSSRLVQGDGTRRNEISAYAKTGSSFDGREGVWEIDTGQTHNTAGSVYVLTTVRDNVVTFEAYDQIVMEPFKLVETWSVRVGNSPTVAITSPTAGTTFTEPAEVTITADASDADGSVTQVAFYAGATLIGVDTASPFAVTWSNVAAVSV